MSVFVLTSLCRAANSHTLTVRLMQLDHSNIQRYTHYIRDFAQAGKSNNLILGIVREFQSDSEQPVPIIHCHSCLHTLSAEKEKQLQDIFFLCSVSVLFPWCHRLFICFSPREKVDMWREECLLTSYKL